MNGKIEAICISQCKGERKAPVESATLTENHGIEGDAHAGPWHRQISLLAAEDIETMRAKGLELKAGDFAENLVVSGLALAELGLGSRIQIGRSAELRISQIGKVCHTRCEIYQQTGDCIMPRRGVFARVTRGGSLRVGDMARVIETVPRKAFQCVLLTISDRCSRGKAADTAGPALAERMRAAVGANIYTREIIPDEQDRIADRLKHYCDGHSIDIVLAVGGTGFAPRDITPEAVAAVVERRTPGLDEAMRRASSEQTPHAMLSRALSGIRGGTLIVSLPGSKRAAVENLEAILPALEHGLAKLRGDPSDCGRPEGGTANEHETGCPGEKSLMTTKAIKYSCSHSRSLASMRGSHYPAFGICGYSGSGKTTLIERLVPRLRERGLKVGVIKQDAHGLDIDREGKDTDRLFKAGADVLIRDREQAFARLHGPLDFDLHTVIERAGAHWDLILVEGHKSTPLPCKVWLAKADDDSCPPEAVGVQRRLGWTEDRERIVMDMLDEWLRRMWLATPVYAGILIGGASQRMGRPKHLIEEDGQTWLHKAVATVQDRVDKVVFLGDGEIPADLRGLTILPDVDDAQGPLRGMRAAMRWAPRAGWLFAACDQPDISPAAVDWLLARRRPGVRAVMPVLPGATHPEPLLAYYDFRMAPAMELVSRPRDLAAVPGATTPTVPSELAPAWRNLNSPANLVSRQTR